MYDQTVTLDIESVTTILLDQSGKQGYPIGGAVESLTNGVTITGSETPMTKATFMRIKSMQQPSGCGIYWVL